jgi:hypothetical protein
MSPTAVFPGSSAWCALCKLSSAGAYCRTDVVAGHGKNASISPKKILYVYLYIRAENHDHDELHTMSV